MLTHLTGCVYTLDWVCLQAYLKSTDMGDTVEQVEALIKRHDAFTKLLTAQDQKVSLFSLGLNLADWLIVLTS